MPTAGFNIAVQSVFHHVRELASLRVHLPPVLQVYWDGKTYKGANEFINAVKAGKVGKVPVYKTDEEVEWAGRQKPKVRSHAHRSWASHALVGLERSTLHSGRSPFRHK